MKTIMMMAFMAAVGMANVAMAETATSGKAQGIWGRFGAYDIGNVRPQPVVAAPSPTTVKSK